MDGLSRAVGAGPTITLCGETFTVKGKVIRHYAEIEAEIVKQRGNPFDYLAEVKDLFKDDQQTLRIIVQEGLAAAKTWRDVSGPEITGWINDTFRGHCFMVWLAIRDNEEGMKLERATQLYTDELERIAREQGEGAREKKRQEIEQAIDQASGEDLVGNSNGSQPGAENSQAEPAGQTGG